MMYLVKFCQLADPRVLVGKVTILDYDDPNLDNSKFDLELLGQTPYPSDLRFQLDGQDVYAVARLDREEQDKYFLSMRAIDRGNPQLTGSGTVTITVADINDNIPFFNQSYKFVLPEQQTSGKLVLSFIL